MSTTKNLFSILADDIEEPDLVAVKAAPAAQKEVVKPNTSSKKEDVPPRSARPEKAKPKKPSGSKTEDAFNDKSAGRQANRTRPTDGAAPRRGGARGGRRQFDRQSNEKADSQKQVEGAWGGPSTELQDEKAADVSAKKELAEEGADAEAAAAAVEDNSKTLEEYLAELALKKTGDKLEVRKANDGEDGKWGATVALVRDESESANPLFAGLKTKAPKATKAKKEKQVVDFEPVFAERRPARDGPRGERSERGRGGARGGRGGARGGRDGARDAKPARAPKAAPAPAFKVSLSNTTDFPSLQ
ncbi:uncharacterized protein V1510DRAFT_424018 [Dipodascopsis tothii]|uniref:uncharacterized protein n=1 Tax=Dipodascopsis tothii TaxID=44089 RepID=UPI0034CD746A